MNKRLERIYKEIPSTNIFADIGCDHGYIALAMIKSNKCKRAVCSDISEKSLKKAKDLFAECKEQDKAEFYVADGFNGLPKVDTALIAGMGGEEIISIISSANSLPQNLIVQPMKNVDRVREKLIELGYKIERDFIFYNSGVYYNLIITKKGKDSLTKEEVLFGRTNILSPSKDFIAYIKSEIEKIDGYLSSPNISDVSIKDLKEKREKLSKYANK